MDKLIYLGNAKDARPPHGLRCVVAQVLVIINRDDGRELFQRRRMGAFSVAGTKPVVSPLPLPRPSFFSSTLRPTTVLGTILGFLGRQSVVSGYFLLVDRLDEPVPLEGWPSACFFKAACSLM